MAKEDASAVKRCVLAEVGMNNQVAGFSQGGDVVQRVGFNPIFDRGL
eukprot:CAMPEP_0119140820 /NCGR_PEP_ID=MMETSP1310-20130426/29904_1 /TAXON_ID=464262 /ORGANISM="Genus nov. species nov., Strain RCC2339" /LENGTH=46 /DNA_ID= /DNA_START= /DNA_END= /DNA_ORIENTATION=